MYPPTPIDNRSMEYHYTTKVSPIAECTYTEDTSTPNLIDHKCVEYCYTKYTYPSLQLTIDLWNTITPNKFTSTPTPIDNQSMEYSYTK